MAVPSPSIRFRSSYENVAEPADVRLPAPSQVYAVVTLPGNSGSEKVLLRVNVTRIIKSPINTLKVKPVAGLGWARCTPLLSHLAATFRHHLISFG